jgi:hypothetical protein
MNNIFSGNSAPVAPVKGPLMFFKKQMEFGFAAC